jgi:Cd2+/Zn2+-exporting ATPase
VIAEMFSNHPIAKSIKECLKNQNPDAYTEIEENQNNIKIEEIHGKGIKAIFNGDEILAGNAKLLAEEKVECDVVTEAGTVVYVAKNNVYMGYALIEDQVKETSKDTIQGLKKLGVNKTVMLTGDRKEIAEKIAGQLGLDEVYSELMPEDKVKYVEQLIKDSKTLAFVGDGINDAPVLARADVGIAMGAMGSDAAIEAADIVLMDDNPLNIAKSIKLSRRTLGIAKQNIIFALVVKIAVLILAAFGIATMWAAVFADVGVCVIAIINAMRCSK